MKIKVLVFLLVFFLGSGCVKEGRIEFVAVCEDHAEITSETLGALIKSVLNEIDEVVAIARETGDNIDIDRQTALEDLLTRLYVISNQSVLINRYVHETYVDKGLILEMVRSRWRK